jgi:multidrug efflux pump
MSDIALKQPGVERHRLPRPVDQRLHQQLHAGIVFVGKPFDERKARAVGQCHRRALNQKFGGIQDAFIAVFPPPPVMGLGTWAASRCRSKTATHWATTRWTRPQGLHEGAARTGSWPMFSSYQINVPQLDVDSTAPRPSSWACR